MFRNLYNLFSNPLLSFNETDEFRCFVPIFDRLRTYKAVIEVYGQRHQREFFKNIRTEGEFKNSETPIRFLLQACTKIVEDIDFAINSYNKQEWHDRSEAKAEFIDAMLKTANQHEMPAALQSILSELCETAENVRDSKQTQVVANDSAFYKNLLSIMSTTYLKIKYAEDYTIEQRKTDPEFNFRSTAEEAAQNSVALLTATEVNAICQPLLVELDSFAFHLLVSKHHDGDLSTLNDHSPDALKALKQFDGIRENDQHKWAFVHDGLAEYFAARYIAGCMHAANEPIENEMLTSPYQWVADQSIQEFVFELSKDDSKKTIWKHVLSLVSDDTLFFFQEWKAGKQAPFEDEEKSGLQCRR